MDPTADLWTRLTKWAIETHGWPCHLGVRAENADEGHWWDVPEEEYVTATIGPVTGYGRTTNDAIDSLATGLVEEGWPDDREEEGR